jgi:hypothetical protein
VTPPAAGDPAAPAAPVTPPAAPPPERPPRKLESAAEAAERAIKEATERLAKAPTPPSQPEPEPEADPATAYRIQALEILQRNPKFKGRDLKGEYVEYMGKVERYEAEWTKANPGEKFDIDDDRHDGWCEQHEPDISEEDIRIAETQVGTLQVVDDRKREEEDLHLARKLVSTAAVSAQSSVADILTFPDGEKSKTYETIEALEEEDPIAAFAASTYVPQAASVSTAIVTLLTPGSPIQPDRSNPMHREVLRQVAHYETEIMRLPAEQRIDGQGRRYVPENEYVKMTPADRAKAWTFRYAPEEMRALAVNDIRQQMQGAIKRVKSKLPAGGGGRPPAVPTPPPRSGGAGSAVIPTTPSVPDKPSRAFWGQ